MNTFAKLFIGVALIGAGTVLCNNGLKQTGESLIKL